MFKTLKDTAIDLACSDIGLTEQEAYNAWEDMGFDNATINPCCECGIEVDNLENDICEKCWNKWDKSMEEACKARGIDWQAIKNSYY